MEPGSSSDVPEPPEGLGPLGLTNWETFWRSPQAGFVIESHRPALHRLFGLYDELAEVWELARKHRLVVGSSGQPVVNPLIRVADTLRAEIRALEDRFGLTPLAKARLEASSKEPDAPDEFAELVRSMSPEVGDAANAQPPEPRPRPRKGRS